MINEGAARTMVLTIVQTVAIMLKPAWARLPVSETCKDICECDSIVSRVDCTGMGLAQLPNIRNNTRMLIFDLNIRYLSLENNTIDEIERNSFLYPKKILKLNLNGNQFGEVPVALEHLRILKDLKLANNQIRTLSKVPWCNLTRLERLHLDNNGIPNLPLVMTSRLNKLIEMSVSYNNITAIPVGQFYNMSNLEYLDLSYNQISTNVQSLSSPDDRGVVYFPYASDMPTAIPDLEYAVDDMAEGIVVNSFRGLSILKVLNLKGNRIQELVSGILDDMGELRTLLLDDNELKHIEADVFRRHIHLRFLSLSRNKLTELHPTLFEDLRELEELFLDNNHITDLTALTRVHMFHLRKLSAKSNRIKTIAPPGFKYFQALQEIYLSHNRLTEFLNVQNLTHLIVLDLGNNRIKQILPINVFEGTSIREIYLPYNRFESLEFTTFVDLKHLQVLDATGHRYICDCQLNWVMDEYNLYEYAWLYMPDGTSLDKKMFCQSPNMLKNLALYDGVFMGIDSLDCTEYADPHRVMILIASWSGIVSFFLLVFWMYVYFDFKKRFYIRKPRKRYLLIHNVDESTGLPYHHLHPYVLKEQDKVRLRSCESDTESLDMLNCNFDEETTV
ncbi:uncharacterized protein [Amphiura filiformis]|uniref:uncharacterized protein n=1 Tax=Amphiura filiformis TaxID=82378 RepID=UPI003B21D06C